MTEAQDDPVMVEPEWAKPRDPKTPQSAVCVLCRVLNDTLAF